MNCNPDSTFPVKPNRVSDGIMCKKLQGVQEIAVAQ